MFRAPVFLRTFAAVNFDLDLRHDLTCSDVLTKQTLLSPPVQFARWAHMHRFLSVCPSVRPSGPDQKSD